MLSSFLEKGCWLSAEWEDIISTEQRNKRLWGEQGSLDNGCVDILTIIWELEELVHI